MGGCDESYMCKIATMALASATISHEIGHHSACFLPQEVGIHKFGSTYVRSKDRKKTWKRWAFACLSPLARAKEPRFRCLFPGVASLEG